MVADWSFWDHATPPSIARRAIRNPPVLEPDLCLVIQGVRRCGKSTLQMQIMNQIDVDPLDCAFINFEDPRLLDSLSWPILEQVVTMMMNRRGGDRDLYFFLDEIQNVDGWESWLHSKLERSKHHFFTLTGSNATLLSGRLSTALTGRHRTLELFPFDFGEYLKVKPEGDLDSFIVDGGYPRALTYPQPTALLREYFQDIIERDIRPKVGARNSLVLGRLVKMIFESMGTELSLRNIAKVMDLSVDTVSVYIDACVAAYMVLPCRFFTFSEKQRLSRPTKYYPIDLALRTAVITNTGKDRGKSLECMVYQELRRNYENVFYWRGSGEVDFVTVNQDQIIPWQVSWDGVKPRHLRALKEFKELFPQAQPIKVINRCNAIETLPFAID